MRWAAVGLVLLGWAGCSAGAPDAGDGGFGWGSDGGQQDAGRSTYDVTDADTPMQQGRALYLKRVRGEAGETTDWRAVPGARVEVRDASGAVLYVARTEKDGAYAFPVGLPATAFAVVAQAEGPRLNVVVAAETADRPWTAVSESPTIRVEERYAAGALNVVVLAGEVADRLDGLVADATPGRLVVLWGETILPACGSCFFDSEDRLELSGEPGEEDAHDDSVVLHEIGHWVEDAYGTYDNPGGFHDRQRMAPTLAWSEGFATWFQGALRGAPDFVDPRPGGFVYLLDLETPVSTAFGTEAGALDGRLSEALVYGLLWDLTDAPAQDDDPTGASESAVLSRVVQILADRDLGPPGADLVDFLNGWRCADRSSGDMQLGPLLDAFGFPLSLSDPPVCR